KARRARRPRTNFFLGVLMTASIYAAQAEQFAAEGYAVFPGVLTGSMLVMAEICRATLGDDVYFFFDQFVVKGPEGGMSFGWHQDSGYVVGNGGPPDHLPYLTCWCPLDDATAEDGTVRLIPFSANPKSRGILPHERQPKSNDLVAQADVVQMRTVEASAGSVVAFSSRLLHSTGPNLSSRLRRVYLAQYTAEAMLNPGPPHLRNNAVPLLWHGEQVTVA